MASNTRRSTGLGAIGTRLEQTPSLDHLADPLHWTLEPALESGAVADVLHGRWLGHPAHPLLTDLPIGFWTSAWVLDLFGGDRAEPVADALIALGVVTVAPTALTGWADWVLLPRRARRVGVVHATSNLVATGLYLASLVARRSGDRPLGIRLAHLGAAAATFGGLLGGHQAFGEDGEDGKEHGRRAG